jgi:hypothetical protein
MEADIWQQVAWLWGGEWGVGVWCGVGAALGVALVGMVGGGRERVRAGRRQDGEGRSTAFTLILAGESIVLEPGKAWSRVDAYKWVPRGLIEEPQSFHVSEDGTVEINGERIALAEDGGEERLEREVNKRHERTVAVPGNPVSRERPGEHARSVPDRVLVRVKLDHLGHLVVEASRGEEQVGTGLRGLPGLVQNGFLRPIGLLHIDPLQRAVEVDGVRYEATEEGARALEQVLNERYAMRIERSERRQIMIRENPASSTGFDIHCESYHGGMRLEIKGYLGQDKLDLLQDHSRTDLLREDMVLRLAPPLLLIRKKRSDGGEERVPDLPDVAYRRVTAAQLQAVFNHPRLRRGDAEAMERPVEPGMISNLRTLRVSRRAGGAGHLWLELLTAGGRSLDPRALTHHNVVELQASGVFDPRVEVTLSLDQHRLTVRDRATGAERHIDLGPDSSEADLGLATSLLSGALKPCDGGESTRDIGALLTTGDGDMVLEPAPMGDGAGGAVGLAVDEADNVEREEDRVLAAAPVRPPEGRTSEVVGAEAEEGSPAEADKPRVGEPDGLEGGENVVVRRGSGDRFSEPDPVKVHEGVFRELHRVLGVDLQDVRLSLPRVFENRRFEVLSFSHPEVGSLAEIRSEDFYGFYLSHQEPRELLLVYACAGCHVEWGVRKCVLQAGAGAEAEEREGSALRGLVQDEAGMFVFVVEAGFRGWVRAREGSYWRANARFASPEEVMREPERYTFVWPR